MLRIAIPNFIAIPPARRSLTLTKTGKRARIQSNYSAIGGDNRVGRPSAKQRKPYNLDAILDVAVRVFRERGYDGSTLDDVARAAGITKASIYYHVRSKEELLARGVGRALDALFAVLDERPAKRGRAAARLRYIVHRTIEITVDQLPEVALLLRVRGNTPVERRIMERRRAFDHLIARRDAQCAAPGRFARRRRASAGDAAAVRDAQLGHRMVPDRRRPGRAGRGRGNIPDRVRGDGAGRPAAAL